MSEKTTRDHLRDMLHDPLCHGEMTGYQENAVAEIITLLERCIFKHMCELVEAEEQGRLVVLPCKVGSKIFEAYEMFGKVFQRIASKEDMLTKILPGWGKRYFATPEEAEAALKGARTDEL